MLLLGLSLDVNLSHVLIDSRNLFLEFCVVSLCPVNPLKVLLVVREGTLCCIQSIFAFLDLAINSKLLLILVIESPMYLLILLRQFILLSHQTVIHFP